MKFAVVLALGATAAIAAPAGPEPPTEPSPRVHPISSTSYSPRAMPLCGYKDVKNSNYRKVKGAHCCCFRGNVTYRDVESLLGRSIEDSALERRGVKSLKDVTLSATSVPFIDWVSVLVPLATPTSSTKKSTFHRTSAIHTSSSTGWAKPGLSISRPGFHTLKPIAHPSKTGKLPYSYLLKPVVASSSTRVHQSKPTKSAGSSSKSVVSFSKPAVSFSKPAVSFSKPAVSFSKPAVNPSKPTNWPEKPVTYPGNSTKPHDVASHPYDVDVDIDFEAVEIHEKIHYHDGTDPDHEDYYYYAATTLHPSLNWSSPFYHPKSSGTFKSGKGKIVSVTPTLSRTTSLPNSVKYSTHSSTSTLWKWYSKSVKSVSTSTSTSSVHATFKPTHPTTHPTSSTSSTSSTPTPSPSKSPYSHFSDGKTELDHVWFGLAHDNASEVFGDHLTTAEYKCICAEEGKLEFFFGYGDSPIEDK
ncbi:uncharacterized protein BDZ99DRAFT_463303 [Mytilinidion resinicola]|uniref:Uncharacterized protein n=1 Tax=Mytilinidion resinicola TaxID=574789 RepID=A0A6A6YLS7_9PEZI|nr:uncharacterized protein BDZ99DRAFT_463303 [Mytilinidion resinicola]KAF2809523.1 hypothetical protein BDZ99DRAFT_463303 [Mytilinidion resinicola]